jgi:hypothetical protein
MAWITTQTSFTGPPSSLAAWACLLCFLLALCYAFYEMISLLWARKSKPWTGEGQRTPKILPQSKRGAEHGGVMESKVPQSILGHNHKRAVR